MRLLCGAGRAAGSSPALRPAGDTQASAAGEAGTPSAAAGVGSRGAAGAGSRAAAGAGSPAELAGTPEGAAGSPAAGTHRCSVELKQLRLAELDSELLSLPR